MFDLWKQLMAACSENMGLGGGAWLLIPALCPQHKPLWISGPSFSLSTVTGWGQVSGSEPEATSCPQHFRKLDRVMYITDLMLHRLLWLLSFWAELCLLSMKYQLAQPGQMIWLWMTSWGLEAIREKQKRGQLRKLIFKVYPWSTIYVLKLSFPAPARMNLLGSLQHSSLAFLLAVWTYVFPN